jgi:hypothetical protein
VPILGGAAPRRLSPDRRGRDHPADVAALGTARVLSYGAAARRLGVDGAAPEASHRLEHGQRPVAACPGFHVVEDTAMCGNLRGPTRPRPERFAVAGSSPPARPGRRTGGMPASRVLAPRPGARTPRDRRDTARHRPTVFAVRRSRRIDPGRSRHLRCAQAGRAAARVSSTSRAICSTSSSSLANARSSRRRRHSSTTSRRP